jgi:hypothetical protein
MREVRVNNEKKTTYCKRFLFVLAVGLQSVFGTSSLRMAGAAVATDIRNGRGVFEEFGDVIARINGLF